MAILSPADLPVVLKLPLDPVKKYVLSKLGHPQVEVEIAEDQWETIMRVSGDFAAGYFPREQKLAVFYTQPLVCNYPMPVDAYWIQEVAWNPVTTQISDVFGAESYLFNIGNISGIQNILVDYHLLQSYRKFSQKVLGTEGHWEVINEGSDGPQGQQIRLYPTPKGAFPVTVLYYPVVNYFRSPQAKMLVSDMALAEAKIALGSARRKLAGFPLPDGGSINYDGGDLVQEGEKAKEELTNKAIALGEPLGVYLWNLLPLLFTLAGVLKSIV